MKSLGNQIERARKITAYGMQLEMDTSIIRSMCQILGKPLPTENWWTDEYIEVMALCPRDEGALAVWEEVEVCG